MTVFNLRVVLKLLHWFCILKTFNLSSKKKLGVCHLFNPQEEVGGEPKGCWYLKFAKELYSANRVKPRWGVTLTSLWGDCKASRVKQNQSSCLSISFLP